MSTSKYIDRICIFGLVFAILLSALFVNGEALGIQSADRVMGYENRLFDTSRVHTIDIIMDDWDSFVASCQSEEYAACSVVIDGEAFKNVAIRGKGNTSLSSVASMDSDRYSFKIEFDHYDSTKTYHGLDKLSLNNIIQDTTFMKDYLTYQLMGSFGAAAPLCSYVYITVNGEDWGLYLAAEGVEDAFLQRSYGSDHGELYKPDSMSFGGGRGNGKDFNMEDFMADWEDQMADRNTSAAPSDGAQLIQPPGAGSFDPGAQPGGQSGTQPGGQSSERGQGGFDRGGMGMGGSLTAPSGQEELQPGTNMSDSADRFADMGGNGGKNGDLGGMSMGSSDVLLQYTDDDPASYSNIFSSAKTNITEADQTRLIQALKALSEGDAESSVNIEQVIRYFVVHNFVVNGDSYTGSMIHNYYLYEEDGKLEMLPWDYNLAFGTFQGNDADSAVNDPIDTPLSVTGSGRPIIDWIFASEEYTALYHQYFAEFLAQTDFAALIDKTVALIAPYVEKDPTSFYSYAEFEAGTAALREFCLLREESVQGQLDGVIPTTSDGQRSDPDALVDASHIDLSAMGSMSMGGDKGSNMGGDSGGSRNDRLQNSSSGSGDNSLGFPQDRPSGGENPLSSNSSFKDLPTGDLPGMNGDTSQKPEGMTRPTDGFSDETSGTANSSRPTGGDRMALPGGTIPGAAAGGASSATWALTGVSVLLLAAAVFVAKKYKR